MEALLSPDYQDLLVKNKLADFEAFWQLPENWVEVPNQRRGGWSGVSTTEIIDNNGEVITLYIKRQHDHTFRSIRHPFGKPTAWREYNNNQALKNCGIPVPASVFYQEVKIGKHSRAVMATIGIKHPVDLKAWLKENNTTKTTVDETLKNIASDVRKMHDAGFEHRALHGKHILLEGHHNTAPKHFFIDLETVKHRVPNLIIRVRDICQLFRHTSTIDSLQRELFLAQYLSDSPKWESRLRETLLSRIDMKNARSQ